MADWIARRMSMSFAAGYLGHKPLPMSIQDVQRQLKKMGYCEGNAQEIAGLMEELHLLLHRKGLARMHLGGVRRNGFAAGPFRAPTGDTLKSNPQPHEFVGFQETIVQKHSYSGKSIT